MKYFKKIANLFSLFSNELAYSGLLPVLGNELFVVDENFGIEQGNAFKGNFCYLPLDTIASSSFKQVEFIKFLSPKKQKMQLALHLSDSGIENRDTTEKLLQIIAAAPHLKYSVFFNATIPNVSDWEKIVGDLLFWIHAVNNHLSKNGQNLQVLIEINKANYLFADDFRLFFLKYLPGKFAFVAHPEYFSKPEEERTVEYFHVRNFFDSLSRDKSLAYGWRNFYHRFALGELPHNRSLYKVFSNANGIPNNSVYKENSIHGIELHSLINKLLLPSGLFKINAIPPLGFEKLLSAVSINLQTRLNGQPDSFELDPINNGNISTKGIRVKEWKTVLITGWYGTETQGDKAILGEVLHFIKSASPDCKIILTTLHRGISEQTNLELEHLKGVELVDLDKSFEPSLISRVDAVIVGGGPLMESASMKYIGYIFAEGYKQNKDRIIFGCGIGPIHSPEVEKVTRYLLSVCQAGFVRDKESFEFAHRLFPAHKLKFACDPAVGFVNRWRKEKKLRYTHEPDAKVATLLRANTNEFSPESNPETLRQANEALAGKAAKALECIARKTGSGFALLHMNAPWVGGDDRIYNRILASQLSKDIAVELVRDYLTLEEHMLRLSACKAGLAMRYHGHIFCLAMGIPFVSLDYTGKSGKVSSLVSRIGYSNRSYQWDLIDPEKLSDDFAEILASGSEVSSYLIAESEKLVALLHQTYREVFDFCPENK